MKGFGTDLKNKGQRALDTMAKGEDPGKSSVGTARPVTSMGNLALIQPQVDALNERTKNAEKRATAAIAEAEVLQARAAALERQLSDQPTEIALSALVEVPGRRRKLTVEEMAELTENLRLNPLVTPISVKSLSEGRYEIVSGHNRVHAFRELGRQTIAVAVVAIEDESVEKAAFYANLMQPTLPDYAKFQGFRQERDKHSPKLSQRDLARAAGVAEKFVSRLFAFEDLPERALELIDQNPHVIGTSCVAELVKCTKAGASERVIQAVQQLVAGEIGQKEAVSFASRPQNKLVAQRADPVRVRAGRADFCRYTASGSTLRIEFKDEAMRVSAEKALDEVLRRLAHEANDKLSS